MKMNKSFSAKLDNLSSYGNDFKDLLDVHYMDGVPEDATYDIHFNAGDRPWESGTFTITFRWSDSLDRTPPVC